MKVIGLLGGMSWESTQSYYRAINEGIKRELGGLHSAKIVLYSVDFAEIEALQRAGAWDKAAELLTNAAQSLQRAGADFLLIGTNTMHKVAPAVQAGVDIPVLHIADAMARALQADRVERVGLLGTRFTMEQPFFIERVEQKGIAVLTPNEAQRTVVHDIIFNELCLGIISRRSNEVYLEVMDSLVERGAQAMVLGCTEIALLIKQVDTSIRLYDTAEIHAAQAVQYALGRAL